MSTRRERTEFMKPRILFIGFPETSHTSSWIELLNGTDFDVRLFGLPSGLPPSDFSFPTYATIEVNSPKRFPQVTQVFPATTRVGRFLQRASRHVVPRIRNRSERMNWLARSLDRRWPPTLESALAKVIREWQPDIIHTLGFDAASYFYHRSRNEYGLQNIGRWIAQARGGPDLDLNRYLPERMAKIRAVFEACDHFICDNDQNYEFALSNGLDKSKVASPGVGIVSGPGGLDVKELRSRWSDLPSQRSRRIIWPKAYETISSKGLPVLEALTLAWDRIQPCQIEMLWVVQDELRIYFERLLPAHIRAHCNLYDRVPRERVFELMAKSRVMLAPSLTDGIPNTMMEAMAFGAFPIVSPLATITPVVSAEKNVLFARNLYPHEIAEALVRAMNDDALVDAAAEVNADQVLQMADRDQVRARVTAFYREVAVLGQQ